MQMDTVIASVLPFVARRDEDDDYSDMRRRPQRSDGPRGAPRGAPELEGRAWQTLGELYTRLTLDEEGTALSDRPITSSDSLKRQFSREKRNVEVRVSYLKVFKIDTRKQTFDADIFVQGRWEEPRLDGKSHKDLEDFVIDGYWNPEIYIHNLVGSPDRQETWCDVKPGDKHPLIVWKMRIKGSFNERLELEDFPFDVQELQIKVASRLTEEQVTLMPDSQRLSTVNKNNMVDHTEWVLYNHVDSNKGIIRNKLPTAKHHHPCVAFMCSARRNPTFYAVNIFFMMFMLCSLVFCTVGIPATAYDERLKINIVLLLSVVAMKYVSTNFYPVDLAYLTYMDIYNLLCVFMVAIMAVQNAILYLFTYDLALLVDVDNGSIYLIIALFLLVQLVSIVVAIAVVCRAKYQMRRKDKEYDALQREMNYDNNRKAGGKLGANGLRHPVHDEPDGSRGHPSKGHSSRGQGQPSKGHSSREPAARPGAPPRHTAYPMRNLGYEGSDEEYEGNVFKSSRREEESGRRSRRVMRGLEPGERGGQGRGGSRDPSPTPRRDNSPWRQDSADDDRAARRARTRQIMKNHYDSETDA